MTADLFDPAYYAALQKPLLEASALPPECYTSAAFFEREIERLFKRHWQFVGREEQAQAAGDYFCYDGLGGSVIVLRGADGRLRAFANSCRHRGARLLSSSGRCRRIVCPYHGWCYDLEGLLRRAPGMEQAAGFDAADFPLLQLPLETGPALSSSIIVLTQRRSPGTSAAWCINSPRTVAKTCALSANSSSRSRVTGNCWPRTHSRPTTPAACIAILSASSSRAR